ncbi:MAG: CoA pyrophosphatase [Pseudomonadota bacterium]
MGQAAKISQRISAALAQQVEGSSDYDLNPGAKDLLPPDRVLRPAAVLLALVPRADGYRVLLTRRSARLKHHPGQVAFPGGKVDEADADARAAALREAREEVGLDPAGAEVLGALPPHETVTGFHITPFVALLNAPFDPVPEPGEVDQIFEVPLEFLLDPANYLVHGRRWRGTERFYYAVPWGPFYIWGATARMLRVFADRMAR